MTANFCFITQGDNPIIVFYSYTGDFLGVRISTPKRLACVIARLAKSPSLKPEGKPFVHQEPLFQS